RPVGSSVLHKCRPRVSFGFLLYQPVLHRRMVLRDLELVTLVLAGKLFPIQSLRFTILCEMELLRNINSVQERIVAACARAGREPSSVTLVAVTKGQSPEVVTEAARLGLTLFGENKIQEAKAKIPLCAGRLRWHFIGHLQTNKCREAVELLEMVQSVHSRNVTDDR